MAGVNRVIILGNLGNDPEIRTMQNGDAVAKISVATSESWIDKNTGERKIQTEWHSIVFYRRQAEICGQYLKKGSKVYVEGRLDIEDEPLTQQPVVNILPVVDYPQN